MSSLVLRIKFPETFPVIYKTVRLESNISVHDALLIIAEAAHMAYEEGYTIYIPDVKLFLDETKKLSEYPQLREEVYISKRFFLLVLTHYLLLFFFFK